MTERTDPIPCRHDESTFAFLSRVSGEYWSLSRKLMQDWADRIDDAQEYGDMRGRFRSRDDEQFRSAFFELYLHECLTRAGYSVTLHPAVPGTSRRPDFYVERAGSGFYLEAIAPGTSQAAKAAAQRRAVLFSTVDRLKSADFILWLSELTEGPGQPASAKLRNGLERWLASLRVDDYSSADLAPEWRWEHDGWAASFKAIPKGEGARGISRAGRAIGVYAHTGAIRVDDALSIRAALTEKHHAYGDLDAPFVIAVGTYIFDSDRWHSTNAFYGHEAMQLSQGPDGEWTVIDTELNVCGCGCGGVALSGG